MKVLAYKRIEDGRIFVNLPADIVAHGRNWHWVISGTPTEPEIPFHWHTDTLKRNVEYGTFEEVDLTELKWIHPHLPKPVREHMLSVML